jgi:transposase-like protein
LDALYEKVLVDGQVRDAAVLIASGVKLDGKRFRAILNQFCVPEYGQ